MLQHLALIPFTIGLALSLASLARDARRFPSIVRNLAREFERL